MIVEGYFPKSQRLCSRKAIETLFGSGNRCISAFPLRVVYKWVPTHAGETVPPADTLPCQVLFSVSKRRFKHAVDRNRAKRQMREAWRMHRHLLSNVILHPGTDSAPLADTSSTPATLHLAVLWLADTPLPSALVHRKMKKLLCAVSSSSPSASTSDSSPR